jgi:transcriptional regulator with XRE-family HTH domain
MKEPSDKPTIRGLRLAAQKTQREVAIALNVTERNYVRWEQGETLPDAENLVRLADYFGVHPRVLVPSESLVAPSKGAA